MKTTTLYVLLAVVVLTALAVGSYFYYASLPTMVSTVNESVDLMMEDIKSEEALTPPPTIDDSAITPTIPEPQTLVEPSTPSTPPPAVVPEPTTAPEPVSEPEPEIQEVTPPSQLSYAGAYLSSGNSPVIDFNQSDYSAALAANKTVVLYFYANWCPICRVEIARFYSAMEEINNPQIVGFRVNYKDSDTDDTEVDLARQFGIAYQHTKIIIKNGSQVLKAPQSWSHSEYINNISPFIN